MKLAQIVSKAVDISSDFPSENRHTILSGILSILEQSIT